MLHLYADPVDLRADRAGASTPCSAAPTSAPASGSSPPAGAARAQAVREHAHEAMAPVWEANHVWLIFVLTVVWTAYPTAFGSIASTLSIPLFIAAVGIIFRGVAYALRAGAARPARAAARSTPSSRSHRC